MKNLNKNVNKTIKVNNTLTEHTEDNDFINELRSLDVNDIVSQIKNYNDNYLELKDTIENERQDQRLEVLRELSPNHPILSVISSDIVEDKPKIVHDIKMLSLFKITNDPLKMTKWVEKFKTDKVVIQPKLDGHSISFKYKDGKHVQSVTRGDGSEGNDVTVNSREINGILKNIDDKRNIEVRGEIIIKNSDFKEISGKFANSRNGISIAHIKDVNEIKERKISFIGYNIFVDGKNVYDETEKFEVLKKLGFEVPYYEVHNASDLKDENYVNNVVKSFEKFRSDDNELNYAIDGLVVKINSHKEQLELGENSHDPNWAVAWKYLSEEKTTKLNGIEWTVSRNGYLIPVGLLETVELSGTNVSRVTLNNYSYIKGGDVRIGDDLIIRKSGEIIPFLVKNSSASERLKNKNDISSNVDSIPSSCPDCGSHLEEEGVHIKCSNMDCPGKAKKTISFFAKSLGVDALGEGIVNSLFNQGKIKKPADIFELKESDMDGLDGFGERLAKKIVGNVEKAKKTISAENLIKSLGIPGLGERVAVKLLKKYLSIKNLVENYNIDDVMTMDGFGENNTIAYFEGIEKEKDLLKSLATELGLWEVEKQGSNSMKLNGMSFCITGTLSKGRTEIEKIIEDNSGSNKKDVNKNTDYLVLGENGGSKKDKAEKLMAEGSKIKIITEEEFLNMIA